VINRLTKTEGHCPDSTNLEETQRWLKVSLDTSESSVQVHEKAMDLDLRKQIVMRRQTTCSIDQAREFLKVSQFRSKLVYSYVG
jgi:hypothetical protein